MPGIVSGFLSVISKSVEATTQASSNNGLDKIFDSSRKASELSYSIMNVIYILIAMIIVVAIFTVTLYVYKFIMNRRNPNYKKNDDTFLDD